MDSKRAAQQELAATRRRLRTLAGQVDGSLARGRRLGSLLLYARRNRLLKYGVVAAALFGFLAAVRPKSARGHWRK